MPGSSKFRITVGSRQVRPSRLIPDGHITSDDVLTWNQIAHALAAAAGAEADIVHVPSDAIAAADPAWGASLLGDKAHSLIFDNAKLRGVVPDFRPTIPFEQGAREIVSWYDGDRLARPLTRASTRSWTS
jgi:nucleoside-diphosphate-sugar epimerase